MERGRNASYDLRLPTDIFIPSIAFALSDGAKASQAASQNRHLTPVSDLSFLTKAIPFIKPRNVEFYVTNQFFTVY